MDATEEKDLKSIISPVIGNRRKFLLLRIADMPVAESMSICGVKKATYHSWLQDDVFTAIYRRRDELSNDYKEEAIRLLRRDNQLAAVLLEEQVIATLVAEVQSGTYALAKTPLAKEVYTKLVANLDWQPKTLVNANWESSPIYNLLFKQQQEQIAGSVPALPMTVEGEFIDERFTQADIGKTPEYQESIPVKVSKQTSEPPQEET
jgi:hypothetical protein